MPKRTDIKSVMVIGSGPIVIGQAAEFDYSGTQACRVLREEGIRVILVNSNPATIMTDPEMADATYIEPIATPILEQIIAKERPDALLPTLGGQTALNAAMALGEAGVLKKYNVELIGASLDAIDRGEDRELFKKVVDEAGAESARSEVAHSMKEVDAVAAELGYPLVVRPSFTMGGLGSGIAHDEEELHRIAGAGIHYSPTDEVLIEECIAGREMGCGMMVAGGREYLFPITEIVSKKDFFDYQAKYTEGYSDEITPADIAPEIAEELHRMTRIAYRACRCSGVVRVDFIVTPEGKPYLIEINSIPGMSAGSIVPKQARAMGMSLGEMFDLIIADTCRK